MRIGHGYDVHATAKGQPLVLCGVSIDCEFGLAGHSDADVAAHAVMDALLGAAALGDIGRHFPDSDERYRDANSMLLLREVMRLVHAEGYGVCNIDVTIIAERPRLAPYMPAMCSALATACGVTERQVNVKATTEEGLGFTGCGHGIACHCVCLLSAQK